MRYFLHWPCGILSWPRPPRRAACFLTAAAPPPSEIGADDAAFPSLVASYCRPRPIFQVRASGELARRSTRKGVVRGAASGPRHFRCLQEKEARQIDQKAVQNGRRKKREEGRGPGAGLGSDRPSSREIRLE